MVFFTFVCVCVCVRFELMCVNLHLVFVFCLSGLNFVGCGVGGLRSMQLTEYLRNLQCAPGVQMHEVPPDTCFAEDNEDEFDPDERDPRECLRYVCWSHPCPAPAHASCM